MRLSVHSLFDSATFNERLFFPGGAQSLRPRGALDLMIAVPGAELHARWHRATAAQATILLFHGNGEVVADYDSAARSFATAGAELLVVDFRGYGQSTGTPTLRDAIEDARRVVQRIGGELRRPLVVMGLKGLGYAGCNVNPWGRAVGESVTGGRTATWCSKVPA